MIVAGIFRTLRFGTGEAHGRAEMMEFNYLLENGALTHAAGRYTVDTRACPRVIAIGEGAARDRGSW